MNATQIIFEIVRGPQPFEDGLFKVRDALGLRP